MQAMKVIIFTLAVLFFGLFGSIQELDAARQDLITKRSSLEYLATNGDNLYVIWR